MQPFYAMMRMSVASGLYLTMQIRCEAPDLVAACRMFDTFARGVEATGKLAVLIEEVSTSQRTPDGTFRFDGDMLRTSLANFIAAHGRN